jgi:hypothetical protein
MWLLDPINTPLSFLQAAYARFFVILASGDAAQRESSELRLRRNFATPNKRRLAA